MWATLGTVFVALNGALTFIKGLFGFGTSTKTENTQAVETANKVGADTSDTARATRAQINQDEAANASATNDTVTRVSDADSLRDGSADINNAVARANTHVGSDS